MGLALFARTMDAYMKDSGNLESEMDQVGNTMKIRIAIVDNGTMTNGMAQAKSAHTNMYIRDNSLMATRMEQEFKPSQMDPNMKVHL